MKKNNSTIISICLILSLVAVPNFAFADHPHEFDWVYTNGTGQGTDTVLSFRLDTEKNIYASGYFTGTIDFDPGPGVDELTANGLGGFNIKFDSQGTYQWVRQNPAGNPSVAVVGNGDHYVAGSFYEGADLDPTEGVEWHNSNGANDGYIIKLHADGSFVWARSFGGILDDFIESVTIDTLGNVYVIGETDSGSFDYDPSEEGVDIRSGTFFLSKYFSDGTYGWTRTWDWDQGLGLEMLGTLFSDTNNNVYATGGFVGQSDFDPTAGTDIHVSNGNMDGFVTQIHSDGSYGWTYTAGGPLRDRIGSVVPDSSGNLHIASSQSSTPREANLLKLTSTGTLLWTRSLVRTVSGIGGVGGPIGFDSHGNLIIGGAFYGTVDFNPNGESEIHTATGGQDIFIMTLDNTGNYSKVQFISGPLDEGGTMKMDSEGGLVVAGFFTGTVDFDPGSGVENRSAQGQGSSDLFILKLNDPNHAPVLNPIGDRTIRARKRLQFMVSASDPDHDTQLQLSVQGLPTGASFVDNGNGSGLFNWVPNFQQGGIYHSIFEVSDGDLIDSEPVTITVTGLQVATALWVDCQPPNC